MDVTLTILSLSYFDYLYLAFSTNGVYFVLPDMAQVVFQMPGVQHDTQYEELQRLRQVTLLPCVSIFILLSYYPGF